MGSIKNPGAWIVFGILGILILLNNYMLKCPTPLIKTMTLGQIVIAPSHWTKNLCVFDANTYLK